MPESLPCLTICAPYPFLILTRATDVIPAWIRETFGPLGKRCENRNWFTNFHGPLLIHAGKSTQWLMGYKAAKFEPYMPFGAIVGRAFVYDCVRMSRSRAVPKSTRLHGVFYPELVTDTRAQGEYCWLLKDTERIDQPVPYAGKQGLWQVPAAALEGRTFSRVDE